MSNEDALQTEDSWSTVSSAPPPVTGTAPEPAAAAVNTTAGSDQVQGREFNNTVHTAQHEQLPNSWSSSSSSRRNDSKRDPSSDGVNHYKIATLEMETMASLSSGSWVQRVPWLRSKQGRSFKQQQQDGIYLDSLTYKNERGGESNYVGGKMTTEGRPGKRSVRNTLSQDSLTDFQPSEWTPPDSSYGAAIPVGGWIPKPIRHTIEWTLIAVGVLGLAFVIVATSMRIADGSENTNSGNGVGTYEYDGGTGLDDDMYIPTDDQTSAQYQNNGDDQYSAQYNDDQNNGDDQYATQYNNNNQNSNNGGADQYGYSNGDDTVQQYYDDAYYKNGNANNNAGATDDYYYYSANRGNAYTDDYNYRRRHRLRGL